VIKRKTVVYDAHAQVMSQAECAGQHLNERILVTTITQKQQFRQQQKVQEQL